MGGPDDVYCRRCGASLGGVTVVDLESPATGGLATTTTVERTPVRVGRSLAGIAVVVLLAVVIGAVLASGGEDSAAPEDASGATTTTRAGSTTPSSRPPRTTTTTIPFVNQTAGPALGEVVGYRLLMAEQGTGNVWVVDLDTGEARQTLQINGAPLVAVVENRILVVDRDGVLSWVSDDGTTLLPLGQDEALTEPGGLDVAYRTGPDPLWLVTFSGSNVQTLRAYGPDGTLLLVKELPRGFYVGQVVSGQAGVSNGFDQFLLDARTGRAQETDGLPPGFEWVCDEELACQFLIGGKPFPFPFDPGFGYNIEPEGRRGVLAVPGSEASSTRWFGFDLDAGLGSELQDTRDWINVLGWFPDGDWVVGTINDSELSVWSLVSGERWALDIPGFNCCPYQGIAVVPTG